MKRLLKIILTSILGLLLYGCSSGNYAFAQEGAIYNDTLTATGTFPQPQGGIKVINGGISTYTFFYAPLGAPASVSIQLQGSTDGGVTYGTNCGAAGTATSGVNIITCAGNFTNFRVNLGTFTGGTNPSIIISLFGANPSANNVGVQGLVAVGSPASSENPVLMGTKDNAGNVQPVCSNTSGVLCTIGANGAGDAQSNASFGQLVVTGGGSDGLTVGNYGFNNTTWDRIRTASLSNFPTSATLTARNSIGAAIVENGSRWMTTSAPVAGSQASATIAAEASVRHVLSGFCISAGSIAAPAATSLQANVKDGGTVIGTLELDISAAAAENIQPFCINGLNFTGTTNTALTVEFSAGLANLKESVIIWGFNVN